MARADLEQLPSDRHFGYLFGGIIALVGAYGLYKVWAVTILGAVFSASALLILAALFMPSALRPLNRGWYHFGMLLNRLISPLVLGILYFGLVTPIGLVSRIIGRDELRLRRRRPTSHWIDRDPPGPPGESFVNQF